MPSHSQRIRTLVVDDSPIAVRTICSCLEVDPAVQVAGIAFNGAEALAAAEELQPDIVLLDLQMPGMDGVAVASRLHDKFPEMALFIVTGLDIAGLAEDLSVLGVRAVLPKQHLSDQLPRLLQRFLQSDIS